MAKVGKVLLNYAGDSRISHEIHYDQKRLFSIKGLPDEFIGITQFRNFGYQTELQLTDTVQEACRLYRKLKTSSKLVIAYNISASCELRMNKIGEGSYEGRLLGVSPKITDMGYKCPLASFGIDFILAQSIDNGVEKKFLRYDYEKKMIHSIHHIHIPSEYQFMDFTEERYRFFLNMTEAMKKMVLSISVFVSASPDEAAQLIELNQNAFPMPNNDSHA